MSLLLLVSQLFFAYIIGIYYAVGIFIGMTRRIVFHPNEFITTLLKKKRSEIPKCLNDPTLGIHGFLHLEGIRLHYVANGQEGKPLMLLLHGYPEFWYSWRFQLKEFSDNYRVVAVDMRGFGDSDKPSGINSYQMKTVAEDVKQLIPALGYSQCVLVAHDMGALVAWRFATDYPNMVKQLIIMNVPHPAAAAVYLQRSWTQFRKSWYCFFHQLPLYPEFMMRLFDYKALAYLLHGKHGVTNENISESDVEAYKYTFSKGGFTAPINYYRAMFRTVIQPMKPINKPVLIIWGSPDCAINDELATLSKDYCTNCTLKFIYNASHFINVHKPVEVNKIMKQFLTDSN